MQSRRKNPNMNRREHESPRTEKTDAKKKSPKNQGSFFDFCIIGAGASGLCAAIAFKRKYPEGRAAVIEKKDRPALKINATGNGRCNMTNTACTGNEDVLSFFSSIGVETRTEEGGRIYPSSGAAKDVSKALISACGALGADILTSCGAETLEYDQSRGIFTINKDIKAGAVLISTGGKAGPSFGCTGDGYRLAKKLGHHIMPVYPVLTGLEADGFADIAGVRMKGTVLLLRRGEKIAKESGEIQFKKDGLSGICVMDLSRYVRINEKTGFSDHSIVIIPDIPDVDLYGRRKIQGLAARDILMSIVPQKAAMHILELAERLSGGHGIMRPEALAEDLTDEQIESIEKIMNGGWSVRLKGAGGWKKAQASGGGIDLDEIDEASMGSKLVPGLFFAGEVVDYDGPCGGFNLNHAWLTGIRAGEAAACMLKGKEGES